jgi:hypothetical protein
LASLGLQRLPVWIRKEVNSLAGSLGSINGLFEKLLIFAFSVGRFCSGTDC